MNPYTVINRSLGLNNLVDQFQPARETDLAVASNVAVSKSGFIELAPGYVILDATYPCHSMFRNKGDAFVVQDRIVDSAIMRIVGVSQDGIVLAGVRSGLVKGNRISFCQAGEQTFYTNRIQNGVIVGGASSAWPDQSGHVGAGTGRAFSPAPIGSHIEYWLESMWVAVGNVIYVAEPASVGKFSLNRRHFEFGSDVIMMKAVEGGMWVSTREEIGFIAKDVDFKSLRWIAKPSRQPAHEWSVFGELVDLSKTALQIPGESAVWSSNDGKCVGTQDGQLIVATEERLLYPSGSMGATVVNNGVWINSIW